MEIKAKCKFDKDAVKALAHLSVYKKCNPKKTVIIRLVICFILIAALTAELIVFGFDYILLLLISALSIVAFADCFMYFILPKIQYKALSKMQEAENGYVFLDDSVKVFSKSDEYNGEAKIEYSLFVRIYETSKYFFLFQTKNQVLIVDKTTVTDGSVGDIRDILTCSVNGKYIVCKY